MHKFSTFQKRRVLIGGESKTERGENLLLDDLVGDFASALEGNGTNDGIKRGHKDGVDTGTLQIVRLSNVSRVHSHSLWGAQVALRTLFGFHRVTLSSPYRAASPDNRFLSSTRSFASAVRPGKLASAGCMKGLRPKRSGTG